MLRRCVLLLVMLISVTILAGLGISWGEQGRVSPTDPAVSSAPPREVASRAPAAGAQEDAGLPEQAPPQAQGPLVIVGADGMTFDVLDPMFRRGELPNLRELTEQGARAVLQSERPMRSPALWTTIATGQPRERHRIFDFVTGSYYWPKNERDVPQRLVTSDMRAEPALWHLVGPQVRSLVVGWLNTWPAERLPGTMVAPYVALGQLRQTSIKGKIYTGQSGQVYPPELAPRVAPLIQDAEQVPDEAVAKLVDVPPQDSPLYRAVPKLDRYLYTVRWSIASTLTNTAIVEDQLGSDNFDLVMTYFDGSDTLAHRFWLFRQPLNEVQARLRAHGIDPSLAPELKQRLGKVLEGYYQLVDDMLGRLRAAAGPGATFLVISDHGWGSLPPGEPAPHDHVPFDGQHLMEGIWIAHGPAVRAGTYRDRTLYDVAPTALHLLGLPVPQALPGKVPSEMLRPSAIARRQVLLADRKERVASPPPKPRGGSQPTPFEDLELERLRSLGYVQ